MLITDTKIGIPSKTMIADLLSRNGSPNAQSLSPYAGLLNLTMEQIPDMSPRTLEILNNSLAYPDFDPAALHSQGKQHSTSLKTVRLEDVPADEVKKYAEWLLIGYKINARDGAGELDCEEETRVLRFEDSETDECELLTDAYGDYSKIEIIRAKERLPYLLRTLFTESKSCGVHLISLAIARFKLGELKTKALADRGFYTCSHSGHILSKVEITKAYTNTNKHAVKWAVAWAFGAYPDDEAYRAMLELYTACDILGVDFGKENPEDYSPDLFSRLVATDDPAASGYRRPDASYFAGEIDVMQAVMRRYSDLYSDNRPSPEAVEKFLGVYNKVRGRMLCFGVMHSEDGFLFNDAGFPVVIKVDGICEYSRFVAGNKALLNIDGTAVALTREGLLYQSVGDLAAFLKDTQKTGLYHNNQKHGWWKYDARFRVSYNVR